MGQHKDTGLFAIRGNICTSDSSRALHIFRNSWAVCDDGVCMGVFPVLPEQYRGIPAADFGDCMIIPGFTDLHLHAPQYTYRGTGMDLELIEWLNTYTFPEEAANADLQYAEKAYKIFADDLRRSATTRACVFATIHTDATILLMDLLEETGVRAYVGKVNMDRNGGIRKEWQLPVQSHLCQPTRHHRYRAWGSPGIGSSRHVAGR